MAKGMRKVLKLGLLAVGILLVIAQLVPYGREHPNPPVVQEPAWDSPATRALAVRACFDCHSNQTQWPWYSVVAPFSWWLQNHVEDGRRHLNFSEWHKTYEDADEVGEVIREGEMPLKSYLVAHPAARLSPEERRALEQGLTATVGPQKSGGEHEHDDD